MKIKLFTIPNILTLSNLLCGSIALLEILIYQNFVSAFILIIIAATFDFLDGMMARILNQYSELGRELDSLADIVSFGLVPAIAMFSIFNSCDKLIENPVWEAWGAYIPLLIVCFSALRLARFNVCDDQKDSFVGVPTPANALFFVSLAMLISGGEIVVSAEVVAAVSVIMSIMLIIPMRLFALKFSSCGWRENRVRYIFIMVSALTLALLGEAAIPVIVVIYILVAILDNIIKSSKRQNKLDE